MSQNLQYSEIPKKQLLDARVYLKKGYSFNLGQDEKLHMYNVALRLNTQCFQAYIQKGFLLYLQQEYYEIAVQLDNRDVEIYLQKAKILVYLGIIDQTIQIFKEAFQCDPPLLEYLALGNHLFNEKKYKEALIMCDMLIQLCPKQGHLEKG